MKPNQLSFERSDDAFPHVLVLARNEAIAGPLPLDESMQVEGRRRATPEEVDQIEAQEAYTTALRIFEDETVDDYTRILAFQSLTELLAPDARADITGEIGPSADLISFDFNGLSITGTLFRESVIAPIANDDELLGTAFQSFRRSRVAKSIAAFGLSSSLAISVMLGFADSASGTEDAAGERMSASKIYEECKSDTDVVGHGEANGRNGIDTNTVKYLNHGAAQDVDIMETDLQTNPQGFKFGAHGNVAQTDTRNGHGVMHRMSEAQIRKLRTKHGEPLATLDDYIKFLQDNPHMSLQLELKNYDDQWTPDRMRELHDSLLKGGVIDQIRLSSADQGVVRFFTENAPEITHRYLVGLNQYIPKLKTAIQSGATMVTMTSRAARKHLDLVDAFHKKGIDVSWRSDPDGKDDNGNVWLNGVLHNVKQFVVNKEGVTKYYVCAAVRKAAVASAK